MITVDPEKYANLVKQDPGMAKQYRDLESRKG